MKISSGPVGQNKTPGSIAFDIFNYVFVTLIAITTIIPFIYIIGASFATEYEIAHRPMFLIPQDVTLNAYRYIFSSSKILRGFGNSLFITVCGTAINLFFTVTMAYALSKTRLRGRNFFLNLVIISMFFSFVQVFFDIGNVERPLGNFVPPFMFFVCLFKRGAVFRISRTVDFHIMIFRPFDIPRERRSADMYNTVAVFAYRNYAD